MEGHSTLNHASDHEPTSVTYRPVTKYVEHEECSELKDAVAIEAPLEIRLNGKAWMVTMRSPGFDHDLASGFLLINVKSNLDRLWYWFNIFDKFKRMFICNHED